MTVIEYPRNRSHRAALDKGELMDVILHIGAHRCATTTFQDYMRGNAERLRHAGTVFWGPYRTRNGLFNGIVPDKMPNLRKNRQMRGAGRVQINLDSCAARGAKRLVVSEENMLGSVRQNLRDKALYLGAGERMARYAQAFDGRVTDVMLNIRGLDHYWASSLGYGLMRGRGVPDAEALDRMAYGLRSWRDVITDVSCAVPGARLWVLPFESFQGRPDAQLRSVLGCAVPPARGDVRLNATPRLPQLRRDLPRHISRKLPKGSGRWLPFTERQTAALREAYADDLMWLTSGADGTAWLVYDPDKKPVGQTPPTQNRTRGRRNDQDRRMAGTG